MIPNKSFRRPMVDAVSTNQKERSCFFSRLTPAYTIYRVVTLKRLYFSHHIFICLLFLLVGMNMHSVQGCYWFYCFRLIMFQRKMGLVGRRHRRRLGSRPAERAKAPTPHLTPPATCERELTRPSAVFVSRDTGGDNYCVCWPVPCPCILMLSPTLVLGDVFAAVSKNQTPPPCPIFYPILLVLLDLMICCQKRWRKSVVPVLSVPPG